MLNLTQDQLLFKFEETNDASAWRIVNDGVMGGLSRGYLEMTDEYHGRFFGTVSTENNGGFTMIQHDMKAITPGQANGRFKLKVKGDGRMYQFRVKRPGDYASYVSGFQTTEGWQEITIDFNKLEPSFRGRSLNRPEYQGEEINQLAILIGNKKDESFELLISKIEMQLDTENQNYT